MLLSKIEIYGDGSFNKTLNQVGYGFLILKDGEVFCEQAGQVKQFVESHQIGGELAAISYGLRVCAIHGFKKVHIYCDLEGAEKWATGVWKANKPVSKAFVKWVELLKTKYKTEMIWHWVKSHSNDRYNDRADSLARIGAGLPERTHK